MLTPMADSPELVHRAFQDAFNRHDLTAIVSLYEPDAVMVGPSGPVQGVGAVEERYRNFFTAKPTIEIETIAITRAGNLALLHGRWKLRGSRPDGAAFQSEGRNSEVVRQQADGRWLFVIDNASVPKD